MIYDRKYIDIVNAKKIYADKVIKFQALTADEQKIIDKAFFNTTAINRITSRINGIWDFIIGAGGVKTSNKDVRQWEDQEFFTLSNFLNIRQNIKDVIAQLEVLDFPNIEGYLDLYNIVNDEWIYTNLNNMEKLLYDMGEILDKFVKQVGETLYIFGAYSVTLDKGVLTIE